ncbi:hypothetical protein B7494_g5897 [Chlorociboria aeruginascens]|nr:hypothetical protein B7494_g5897 [Chlorociboria aeruginascens]
MTDYSQLKVPDLKKLLQERSLPISGNKADLIARLQEHEKKPAGATGGEDEIDWDEDDTKTATTAPAAAAVAAGGQGQVANPTVVPNHKVDIDPSTTSDLKVVSAPDTKSAPTTESAPKAEEVSKQDFSRGLGQTDAEKEAEKRAARAKRFGIPQDDEETKKAERAKKFGIDAKESVVKGLDDALPERRKRGREGKESGNPRGAKRQTPDRRTEGAGAKREVKKPAGKILDDPVERQKAAKRAERFKTGA